MKILFSIEIGIWVSHVGIYPLPLNPISVGNCYYILQYIYYIMYWVYFKKFYTNNSSRQQIVKYQFWFKNCTIWHEILNLWDIFKILCTSKRFSLTWLCCWTTGCARPLEYEHKSCAKNDDIFTSKHNISINIVTLDKNQKLRIDKFCHYYP